MRPHNTSAYSGGSGRLTATPIPQLVPRRRFLLAGILLLLFVAYGSLVPLNFQPLPLELAWRQFLEVPYLDISLKHREDLIANVLLYVPIALCLTAAFGGATGGSKVPGGIAAFLICVAAGTTIEFAQLFFPGRTVSLNDMLANTAGAVVGVLLWWSVGSRLDELASRVSLGGPGALRAAVTVYVLGYLALSLFPYDLILSSAELQWKIDSGRYALILGREACGGFFICGVKLAAEVAAVIPLGMLMGMILTRRAHGVYAKAVIAGIALGGAIEIAQFFIVSGHSQGISVVTRGAGMVLGMAVHRLMTEDRLAVARSYLRPLVGLAAVPYLVLLASLNGWFAGPWTGPGTALGRIGEISFMPFYYHYFTTESMALHSLLRIAAVYAPIGVGVWMWHAGGRRLQSANPWLAAWLAGAVAVVVETGKLFVPEKKPDPTDVLIAAAAAYLACWLASVIRQWRSERASPAKPVSRPPPPPPLREEIAHAPHAAASTRLSKPAALGWSIVPGAALLGFLAAYPYGGVLSVLLAVYGLAIWRWPQAALPAVLALLPLLDVAPWTGWFFFTEFDALLLVTLAVLLWRIPARNWSLQAAGVPGWLIWVLVASYAVSASIGLLPLHPLDSNAFSNYLSHYNSLRTLKGFLWAFVLAAPVIHQLKEGPHGERAIVTGILAGLAGVALVALWERHLFTGIFDFSSEFRIGAAFSGLHTGGALVEAYLVMAIPFLAVWFHLRHGLLARGAAVVLFVLASYALIVTFSRSGFAAYAVGLAVVALGAVIRAVLQRQLPTRLLAAGALLVAVCGAVAAPLFGGGFMVERWTQTETDMKVRTSHWSDVLSMMDGGALKQAFGMGLGRFPETYYLHQAGRTGSYRFAREGGNAYLVLGSGQSLWFQQRVPAAPGTVYTVALDVRSAAPNANLGIALCEKTILYSRNCEPLGLRAGAAANQWQQHLLKVKSVESGRLAWYERRPFHLALSNSGTLVEVDNIRLLDPAGRDLVRNGDFSRGHDHWFFSTDFHLPWHTHSLPLQVFFEQGWLGVLALFLALAYAFVRLARGIGGGDTLSAALMAGIVGFFIVGLVDSLFDAPRLAMLFFLLVFAGVTAPFEPVGQPAPVRASNPAAGPGMRAQRAVNVERFSNPV